MRVLTVLGLVLLSGCATLDDAPVTSAADLMWPPAPAKPRIEYMRAFSGPDEMIGKVRLFQRLRSLVSGTSQQRFVRPTAMVQSDANRYFVADPGVGAIHFLDTEKNVSRLIQRENNQPLPSPVGLAAGVDGEVYVTDSRLAALYRIDRDATMATRVHLDPGIVQPTGVAVDQSTGHIYLVDTGSHQLLVYTADGTLLRRVGGRGHVPGRFNYPTMIWMTDTGRILVADSLNFRAQVFDTQGNFILQFGQSGDAAGYLPQSKGIAGDSEGNVYIVDSMLHAVQIFDANGEFLYKLGFRGEGPGEFWLPTGIFINDEDELHVTDSYNGRVQVFRYLGATSP